MQINSIGNQNFGASWSGAYKALIGNAIRETNVEQVRNILAPVQKYFPQKDVDIWVGKSVMSLSEKTGKMENLASVIVGKRGGFVPIGAKFTPETSAQKMLEKFVYALKEISYGNLNKKPVSSGEIHWLNLY